MIRKLLLKRHMVPQSLLVQETAFILGSLSSTKVVSHIYFKGEKAKCLEKKE